MNDKELADKVVALGVGSADITVAFLGKYHAPDTYASPISADNFVRDWRVAGALMEALERDYTVHINRYVMYDVDVFDAECLHAANQRNESLPRAIIEACCEALCEKRGIRYD